MQALERAKGRIKEEEEVLRRITEQEGVSPPEERRIQEEVLRPGEYGRLMAQCSILVVIAGIVVSIMAS